MFEKTLTGILTVIFLGIMGLAIALGVIVSSFWVGALAFIGTMLALVNIGAVGNTEEVKAGFYILHILSIAALAGAVWLAGLQPLWIVIILMVFAALPSVFASDYAFKQGPGPGILTAFLTTLSIPLAIALPAVLQKLPSETWAWSLAVGAVAILAAGLLQAVAMNTGQYFVCAGIGTVTLAGAIWAMDFNTGWWWLAPCLASALLIGGGAIALPRWRTKVWVIGLIFAVFLGLASVGLPLMNAGILPNPFTPAEAPSVAESSPEGTLSAVDIAATQLAAAEATATQAYLDDQQQAVAAQTQTQQALALAKQQTQTAISKFTATPSPVPTATATAVPETLPATVTTGTGPGFFKAIGTFLWQAIKSVWGIVYILVIISIGQTWIKRWGGLILFALLLLAVGTFGGRSAGSLAVWVDLVTSGPANWWSYILSLSSRLTGNIGWGILGTTVLVTVLLIPALKIVNQFSQKALDIQKVQQREGERAAQQYMTDEMMGCRNYLATYVYLLASSALPIALWVTLHRLSTTGSIKFPFLFIPDLTVPHWRPVWHYSYFVIGGIFLLCYLLYVRMVQKNQPENPFSRIGMWAAIPVSILMALLVPSGVMLFMTCQLLLLAIISPILSPKQKEISYRVPQYRPAPPAPEPVNPFEAYLDEIRRISEEKEAEEKPIFEHMEPEKAGDPMRTVGFLEGSAMAILPSPLVGGYLSDDNRLCLLDAEGQLFWLVNGIRRSEQKLDLATPLALHTASGDHLVAVGRAGKVIPLTANQTFDLAPGLNLGSPIHLSTINSYGTLMAYVTDSEPGDVNGLFITAKRDQLFVTLGSEKISCLAFSSNARYLGVGTELGRLIVLDIATHQKVFEIPDPDLGPARFLEATEDEQWICAYGDGWMASWDMQGNQKGLVELSALPASLAIDFDRSLILVGDQTGYLWGYPPDLRSLSFSKQVQNGTVSHIFIATDGTVVTAGNGRELRSLIL